MAPAPRLRPADPRWLRRGAAVACTIDCPEGADADAGAGCARDRAEGRDRAAAARGGGGSGRGDRRARGAARLRVRRADRLPLPAARGGAAVIDGRGVGGAEGLPRGGGAGGAARRRDEPRRRLAADRGRGAARGGADERGAGGRLREPGGSGADRHHQPQGDRGGRGGGLLLRARPVEPARLRDRRQHRHELGRGALPEVRGDDQQPARRDAGADGRHGGGARRVASRRGRLRPARAGLRLGGAARGGDRGELADPAQAGRGAAGAVRLRVERGGAGCLSDVIRAGVLPVAIEFMDRPCIRACEALPMPAIRTSRRC